MTIQDKLQIVKDFQDKYPGSHIGGSLGLLLHGIDLQRSMKSADIDMTVREELDLSEGAPIGEFEDSSDQEGFDFQYSFRKYHTDPAYYTKLEIRVDPIPEYEVIEHEGVTYRASLKEDILNWKRKYAEKGVGKHINDLRVIGDEMIPALESIQSPVDDLPF